MPPSGGHGTAAVDHTICFSPVFWRQQLTDDGYRLGQSFDECVAVPQRSIDSAAENARPLEPGPSFLLDGTTNPTKTPPKVTAEENAAGFQQVHQTVQRLGRGTEDSSREGKSDRLPSPDRVHMDVRFEDQSDSVEHEIERVLTELIYRPSQIVRVLNSTPLGVVANDRQLYRHRQKASHIHVNGKYVSLPKYCAWMLLERRKPKSQRQNRREVAGDCITLDELRSLLHQQDYRCALTGTKLTPSNFALDHIVPIAHGGTFTIDNCQLVTKEVNRAKHTMGQDEFVAMCRDVVRYQTRKCPPGVAHEGRPLLSLMS